MYILLYICHALTFNASAEGLVYLHLLDGPTDKSSVELNAQTEDYNEWGKHNNVPQTLSFCNVSNYPRRASGGWYNIRWPGIIYFVYYR